MATTQYTDLELLLKEMDPSKYSSYHAFMRALILEGISGYNLTFEELNHQLFKLNKENYEELCQTAISYFDAYAPTKIKSLGLKHVEAKTSYGS